MRWCKPILYYDPISIAALTVAAIGGGFAIEAVTGGLGGNKNSSSALPALPSPPDPNAAAGTADAAQTRQRQILLATGGQTDFTGGTGTLLGTDVQKQTLLGGV